MLKLCPEKVQNHLYQKKNSYGFKIRFNIFLRSKYLQHHNILHCVHIQSIYIYNYHSSHKSHQEHHSEVSHNLVGRKIKQSHQDFNRFLNILMTFYSGVVSIKYQNQPWTLFKYHSCITPTYNIWAAKSSNIFLTWVYPLIEFILSTV